RGERLPAMRVADDDECFGRGLLIVTQLADRWGIEPRTVGKTVFAEIAVRPHDGPGTRTRTGTRTAIRTGSAADARLAL
ncbi:hypothetical protein ACFWNS_38965, partial [Streptomyces sp. NPDC058418]